MHMGQREQQTLYSTTCKIMHCVGIREVGSVCETVVFSCKHPEMRNHVMMYLNIFLSVLYLTLKDRNYGKLLRYTL